MYSMGWQVCLLGLLGVPTVFFIPVLLRVVNQDTMAEILVAQVLVNFLGLFVQFGYPWLGPALVATGKTDGEVYEYWFQSIQLKIGVFIFVAIGSAAFVFFTKAYYFLFFCVPLFAQAINSNWLLQARNNYSTGVLFSFIGVFFGAIVVVLLSTWNIGPLFRSALVVIAILMPQIVLGVGTFWVARKKNTNEFSRKSTNSLSIHGLADDLFFVVSQLLLLASGSFGTLMVGYFCDSGLTTAYAATEKLFNLLANGVGGLFMGIYPRLARSFYAGSGQYFKYVLRVVGCVLIVSLLILLASSIVNQQSFSIYLGSELSTHVQPILVPLTVWVLLCIFQHMLVAHLVFTRRRQMVLWANGGVLLVTVLVGMFAMVSNPLYWVYGMVAGQCFALTLLINLYRKDIFFSRC